MVTGFSLQVCKLQHSEFIFFRIHIFIFITCFICFILNSIKIFSTGNFCCAAATSAFLFLPSKVAAVWFGSKERAKATSIAIAADSFGLALGYIQPPLMVANHKNIDDIGKDLSTYQLTVAVQSVMTFIFICSVIQDKPTIPPSESEAAKNKSCLHTRSHISFAFIKRYMKVLKNC